MPFLTITSDESLPAMSLPSWNGAVSVFEQDPTPFTSQVRFILSSQECHSDAPAFPWLPNPMQQLFGIPAAYTEPRIRLPNESRMSAPLHELVASVTRNRIF